MQPRLNAPLRGYNTLALPARAAAFVEVSSDAELAEALAWAGDRGLPVVPLGAGSNIVLAADLQALVIHQQSRGIQVLENDAEAVSLHIAAGENWHRLVGWCLERGYHGLENLALIPGTVGAAPIQNIGAYGVELRGSFLRLHAREIADGSAVVLDREACEFGYRDSVFKRAMKDRLVITAVDLRLSRSPQVDISYPSLSQYFREHPDIDPTPAAVFDAVVEIRGSRLPDPGREPNAGSVFKNPVISPGDAARLAESAPGCPQFPQPDGRVKVPAAWLIEQCGWKGVRRGDVGVHRQHALVLVNHGNGDGGQLLSLAREIARSVLATFGLELEMEPRIYGIVQ